MAAAGGSYEFVVRWQPFLIRPEMPPEGLPKPPPDPASPRVDGRLKNAGAEVGIEFTGKCDRYPNTLQAHALLEFAKEKDFNKQSSLAEAIFKAYFTDGIYPDTDALVTLAETVGLSRDEVMKVLTDQDWIDDAHEAARAWRRKGVSAVPCYFMNERQTFSGAQQVDAFVKMFDLVAERFPLAGTSDVTAKT